MCVRVTCEDGIATVALDRPERGNALHLEMLSDLADIVESLAASSARAAVLTGGPETFCVGADLNYLAEAMEGDPVPALKPLVETQHAIVRRLRALPFPVVAALEGPVVGAGAGLALAADLRVAGESARLVPGYLRIGASPDGGLTHFLGQALGPARAGSVLLLNRELPAAELLDLGLVETVVLDGAAEGSANELAQRVATVSSDALVRMRALLDGGLDAQLDAEQAAVTELFATADFREGVSAFLARRRPQFSSR